MIHKGLNENNEEEKSSPWKPSLRNVTRMGFVANLKREARFQIVKNHGGGKGQ